MAGDIHIDREEQWRAPVAQDSVLDRHLTLTLTAGRWIAIVAALICAALLRLPGLDRWALSPNEAETALAARNLLLGNNVPDHLFGRPFVIEWTALFMFLGDSVDTIARMGMAAAGIAAVIVVLRLGRWIGPVPATAAAVLIALSPTMVATSRRLDGGMLLVFLTLALIGCMLLATERPSLLWPLLTGISAALLILSGPLGVPALLLAGFGIFLLPRPIRGPNRLSLFPGIAAFAVTYILSATAFLTNPGGLWRATAETFGRLFSDHLANAGDRFHVPLVNLIVNEPLLLVLAAVALFAANQRSLVRALGLWSMASFVVISLLGDTGLVGHALVVLPLGLLAGVGASHLISRLPRESIKRGPAAIYVGLLLVLFLALVSLVGLLTPESGLNGSQWIVRFILLALIVILPVAVGLSYLGSRVVGYRLVLVLGAILVLASLLTVRSTVLAASERPGEPMDPLAQGAVSESVPAIVERVHRLSRDLTGTDRSAEDPTGGHGLRLVIDEEISQPFLWYFRDFTNVTVLDPETAPLPQGVSVALLGGDRDPEQVTPGLVGESYLLSYDDPNLYSSPDWADLLGGLVNVGDWRSFWGFMIDRGEPSDDDKRMFQLMVTPAIGQRIFGLTGPYALDDAAGGGTEGGQFNAPRGIVITDTGATYVVDAGNHRIQVFGPDGEFLQAFSEEGSDPGQLGGFPGGGVGGPGGIAIDGDRVYVADTWNHRVQVFSLDGEYITGWGEFFDAMDDAEQESANPGRFYGPRGIAVHDGLVYVTDTGNERVQVFDLDGEFVRMFGTTGSEQGQLLEPVGIAVDDDTVYVADSHNARIARFSLDGEPLEAWNVPAWEDQTFFEPYLATGPDGRIFATSSANAQIIVFGENGKSGGPIRDPAVERPFGIAIAADGNTALVTDGVRNVVVSVDVEPR